LDKCTVYIGGEKPKNFRINPAGTFGWPWEHNQRE